MTAPDTGADPGQPGAAEPEHGQQAPPTCYRHPNRESWVSCVRCGRHACPDCLRDAAVGQQCVECVRGAAKETRTARTVFGGRPTASATVTWVIMAVNVVVFVAELAMPRLMGDLSMLGVSGYVQGSPVLETGVADGSWYRLITSAFTAPGTTLGGAGLIDLALNMWCLYIVGPQLERLFGRVRYVAIYLASAVGGSVLYYFMQPAEPAAGASGAIFGLFAAWFVVSKRLRIDSRGIITLIVANLVFSFLWPGIAWQDHIGGLVTGAVLTAAYGYAPRKYQVPVQIAATVAVAALLAVAVIIRTGQLTG